MPVYDVRRVGSGERAVHVRACKRARKTVRRAGSAGENLVQMLSRERKVARVAFPCRRRQALCGSLSGFARWRPSPRAMGVSAERFSQLFALIDLSRLLPCTYRAGRC
ncbi:hypothetical protein GCM10007388_38590 [Pseudoduganella plicata]|uniref:Uncharacterized protein n=1 Tax=Pseudoduganella plicata TaxID=321984 RepID=A0AA88CA04_9BURK|nr:hypothetical protein GCM10007388_38590 [Pseudoduganella plicata]